MGSSGKRSMTKNTRIELRVSSSKSFSSSCRRRVKNRAFHSGVTMGLMQSRGKGISASALPYKRTPPSWRTSASMRRRV
ncbi:40S ribosomal protein S13 [Linum grandiflorum]